MTDKPKYRIVIQKGMDGFYYWALYVNGNIKATNLAFTKFGAKRAAKYCLRELNHKPKVVYDEEISV